MVALHILRDEKITNQNNICQWWCSNKYGRENVFLCIEQLRAEYRMYLVSSQQVHHTEEDELSDIPEKRYLKALNKSL